MKKGNESMSSLLRIRHWILMKRSIPSYHDQKKTAEEGRAGSRKGGGQRERMCGRNRMGEVNGGDNIWKVSRA